MSAGDHHSGGSLRAVPQVRRLHSALHLPGGFLPSKPAIDGYLDRETDLRRCEVEDFAAHYADTLATWRNNFWDNVADVRALGFDERFIRTWHYYLCYCEAGFREQQIEVSQFTFKKPESP